MITSGPQRAASFVATQCGGKCAFGSGRLGGWLTCWRCWAALSFCALVWLPRAADATTFYVRAGGNDANVGTSAATAWASIRTAAQRVQNPGDVVIVGPGRYAEGDINPVRAGIVDFPIRFVGDASGSSTGDPPAPVLIDVGQQYDTGFIIFGTSDIVVSGFHITGARIAGIQVRHNVSKIPSDRVVVVNNVIFSNGSGSIGRGVQIEDSTSTIVFNNLVYANLSAGVSVGGSEPGSANARIINNTIYGHSIAGVVIGFGGGGSVSPGAWLINNIIDANALGVDVSGLASRCDYVGAYNVVTNGYSASTPHDPSDLVVDPLFVQPAGADGILGGAGYADDNFALATPETGQSVVSPAIDAGSAPASVFGLDQASTRTDGQWDGGQVDLGFHKSNRGYRALSNLPIVLATIFVRELGNDGDDGTSPDHAVRTIQHAASLARANTRILVGPGRYSESDIHIKELTPAGPIQFIADAAGEVTGDSTGPVIVDAGGGDTGFVINGRCSTVIDGFTVTNGNSGGIQIRAGSDHSVVRNNIVFTNIRQGIEVGESNDVQVVNNLAYANGTGGIQAGGNPGSWRAVIQNNTCYGNGDNGIQIGSAGIPSPGAGVRYNIMQGNGKNGIQLDDDTHVGASQSGYVAEYNINADRYAAGTPKPLSDLSLSPLLVGPNGPDGVLGGAGFRDDDFHLSQVLAGQSVDSPGVDYAPVTPKSAGLEGRSTRTDGMPDTDRLDLGFHYPAVPGCSGDRALLLGDCNCDQQVTVDELVLGVQVVLGTKSLTDCPAFRQDGNGQVTVDELIMAVSNALGGHRLMGSDR
jgi:hypothetical protein